MKEPFFFCENQLFGIYQAAQDPSSGKAVVICPPLFDEYRRSYRALSEFATACAQLNYHVLCFDYRGTGDSQLRIDEVTHVDVWLEDIRAAVNEVIDLSGASSITLVGVRGSALLAGQVSQAMNYPVLAWDPVFLGSHFEEFWKICQIQLGRSYEEYKRYTGHSRTTLNFQPFSIDESMIASLASLSWEPKAGFDRIILSAGQQMVPQGLAVKQLSSEYLWPVMEEGLIQPREAMEAMLALMKEAG